MFQIIDVKKDTVDYIVLWDDEWVTLSNIGKKTKFGAGIQRDNKMLFKDIYPTVSLRKGAQTFFKDGCTCKPEAYHER